MSTTFAISSRRNPYGACFFARSYASAQRKHRPGRQQKSLDLRRDRPITEEAAKHRDAAFGLRQAIVKDAEADEIIQAYAATTDKNQILPGEFRRIAQLIHHILRVTKRSDDPLVRRQKTEKLVAFAQELVGDVVGGKLAPHGIAHVHLLGFFKESGARDLGLRFWQWLETQDDLHVSPDVYGAAIELLTVNGAPLSEMEALYQQALTRFPGNFTAYHLLPEAIVPDREATTTLKGVPVALLQGILTARLLRGHTRDAYLSLDTALRLYPDQVPSRFFQLFLEERSLTEAFTVFAIACRGGIVLPSNQCRQMFSALRVSSDLSSPSRHALAVRAMLSITHDYISAGGHMTKNCLGELVIGITQFLRVKGVEGLDAEKKQRIIDTVMGLIRTTLAIFVRYGVQPGLPVFNSIITNLGGFGHSKQIVGIALSDARALGIEINDVTHRSVVTAAGILGDGEFVIKAWTDLVESKAAAGQPVDPLDFHVLIKAARSTQRLDFAKQQYTKLSAQLPPHSHGRIQTALDVESKEAPAVQEIDAIDLKEVLTELNHIASDLAVLDEHTNSPLSTTEDGPQPMVMTLCPTSENATLPEEEMRKLYDELTTEQGPVEAPTENTAKGESEQDTGDARLSDAPRGPTRSSAVSVTKYGFGTLRYENWKSINYLLAQAEASDKSYVEAVDRAIAAGAVPPKRRFDLGLQSDGDVRSHGLSDVVPRARAEKSEGVRKWTAEEIRHGQDEILRLRGRVV